MTLSTVANTHKHTNIIQYVHNNNKPTRPTRTNTPTQCNTYKIITNQQAHPSCFGFRV
jgi:hypothetical protein